MPDLTGLLAPESTAVVTVEMQRGVIGDRVSGNALRRAVRDGRMIPAAVRLVAAARAAGVRVVHATVALRADRAGLTINNRLMAIALSGQDLVLEGTPEAELIPELGPDPADIVCGRRHGLTPFTGTELDSILRNLGVRTIVPAGVSVNVALLGTCLTAADLGYRVVLPVDAVTGVPEDYATAVIEHTLALIANPATVDQVVAAWKP
jgi:nicotinamidase-related amidase